MKNLIAIVSIACFLTTSHSYGMEMKEEKNTEAAKKAALEIIKTARALLHSLKTPQQTAVTSTPHTTSLAPISVTAMAANQTYQNLETMAETDEEDDDDDEAPWICNWFCGIVGHLLRAYASQQKR